MRSLLPAPRTDLGLLVLRLAVALIVIFHGMFKLKHGVAWIGGPLGKFGLPAWLAYGTYLAEVVAPVLLVIGFLARWAALVIAFDMLMAIVLTGSSRVLTINPGGGGWGVELEALIGLSALAIAIAGTGRFAARRD
jgi:putative oxidoreductase